MPTIRISSDQEGPPIKAFNDDYYSL